MWARSGTHRAVTGQTYSLAPPEKEPRKNGKDNEARAAKAANFRLTDEALHVFGKCHTEIEHLSLTEQRRGGYGVC